MSIWNKVDNAKPTTWLVDGMTQEEVRECIDNGKIKCAVLKALEDVRAEIEDEIDKEFDLCVRHSGRDVLRLTCLKEFRSLIDRKVNEVKGDKE